MVTEFQAGKCVLDRDGSCRDVNFTPTTKEAITTFIKSILSQYRETSATDNDGIDRSQQLHTDDPLKGIDGGIHITLSEGTGLILVLRLSTYEDHDTGKHGLEATFFPDEIDAQRFSFRGFQALIDSWNEILQSDDYFVRYENASWDLYDPSGYGVIYSRKQPPVA